MKSILFLSLFVILSVVASFYTPNNFMEGYNNYTLNESSGSYPSAQTDLLVQDTYHTFGNVHVSQDVDNGRIKRQTNNTIGSYDQQTNNTRYPDNPDIDNCTPADMCHVLYKNTQIGPKTIKQLPPVPINGGRRVGYFNTSEN